MANSADPDQLASANWSGSTLFAKQGISGFSRTRVNKSAIAGVWTLEIEQHKHDFSAYCISALTTHWANSADDKLVKFFQENRIWYSMQIRSNPVFSEKFKMSAENFAKVLSVKFKNMPQTKFRFTRSKHLT